MVLGVPPDVRRSIRVCDQSRLERGQRRAHQFGDVMYVVPLRSELGEMHVGH